MPVRRTRLSEGLRPFCFSKIMKKIFLLIIIGMMSFSGIYADTWWNLADDGTLTISDNPDPRSYFSLPGDAPWYKQREKIKKVVMKEGVEMIFGGYFSDCINLTSITIPNSVRSIGEKAFQNCAALTSMDIPNSVTEVKYYAFQNCTSLPADLSSLVFPPNVTNLTFCFSGCTSVTRVPEIPDSVHEMGQCFSGCTSLGGTVTIRASNFTYFITESFNYDYAFEGCVASNFAHIYVPSSMVDKFKASWSNVASKIEPLP